MVASYKKHTLKFNFEAGTSRGVLKEKHTWYICLASQGYCGIGEAGPLVRLSIDDVPDFEQVLSEICKDISAIHSYEEISMRVPTCFPAIVFGLQTAWKDLHNGGKKMVFNNAFFNRQAPIPINGLVWMNDAEHMIRQAQEKFQNGFHCIKFKVGAIDFTEELYVLQSFRKYAPTATIRLDANGAWGYEEALDKLSEIEQFGIHSIEQPLKPGSITQMAALAHKNTIAIALDEELIGIGNLSQKQALLQEIKPQYIILKPTLLGGFDHCDEWIKLAQQQGVGWWNTSALESNIGLNAICQYSYERNPNILHGLGTGSLYDNNIDAPLLVSNGHISYHQNLTWSDL